jgi:hypothetical protein
MTAAPPVEPTDYLRQLLDDLEFAHLVVVAAQLGIADLVASRPLSVADLADATGADLQALYRLLRTLSSRGIFREHEGKQFSLTPLADPLRKDSPDSVHAQALWSGSEEYLRTWAGLSHSVLTGEPAFEHVYGKTFFEYLAEHPALARIFDDIMTQASTDEGAAIAEAHNFSSYRTVIDVGGGHGALLAAILDRYPRLSGVLFDLPDVIGNAHGAIDPHVAAGRVEKVAGSFFDAVPPGGDAYLLKWIVHDWDDKKAVQILTNCRSALAPDGRVLLVEFVIPQGDIAADMTRLDATMLVFTGSRERTESEYAELLQRAGLRLLRTHPTASPVSILEAMPT